MQGVVADMGLGMALAAGLLALACGGGSSSRGLLVEPEAPAVRVGETLSLTVQPQAELAGDVEWEVEERYGGGLLQSQGLRVTYVPPETSGTYHLHLRATGKDGRVQKEVVEVRVVASPSLEPASPRLQPGAAIQFRARMKGLGGSGTTWAVKEPEGGEITADGRYTAPARPGIYHVVATSTVDPTATATATVTVGDN
jgi:hypothetical protein